MDLDGYNNVYLNFLLNKIAKGSISIFLLGDFNVDRLKYGHHASTNNFFDPNFSHMFLPHNIQPTRVTSNFKILTDNIFSKIFAPDSEKSLPYFRIFSNNLFLFLTFFLITFR